MQAWNHESIFADYVVEGDLMASSFMLRRQASMSSNDRTAILQNAIQTVQHLQVSLIKHETESTWIQQLLTYVTSLSQCEQAQTPEEQFNQVYILRKWLFWVPISLLQGRDVQGPALLTLSHFYAVAVALEPLFPDLGSSFCAAMALPPLENIIRFTEAMQIDQSMDRSATELAAMMQYPRTTVLCYRHRFSQTQQQQTPAEATFAGINPEALGYSNLGNLSPAFAPSPLNYGSSYQSSASSTSAASTYLELPDAQSGFSYGTQSWGVVPSPAFSPQGYGLSDEQAYGGIAMDDYRDGLVPPAPIWT